MLLQTFLCFHILNNRQNIIYNLLSGDNLGFKLFFIDTGGQLEYTPQLFCQLCFTSPPTQFHLIAHLMNGDVISEVEIFVIFVSKQLILY